MSSALNFSQLANHVNVLGKLDATTGLYNWPLDTLGQKIVPAGTIVIWSGAATAIPAGWVLCDGQNGTPDLRQRFVYGSGGTVAVGSIGGSASVTLTDSTLPAHVHNLSGSIATSGSHTHTVNDPGHAHSISLIPTVETYGDGQIDSSVFSGGGERNYTTRDTNSKTTGITVSGGDHSHTFSGSVGSAGQGNPLDILPPYYALCYIMKLPYSGAGSISGSSGGSPSSFSSSDFVLSSETATNGVQLRLTAADSSFDQVKLTAGTGITITRTSATEINISASLIPSGMIMIWSGTINDIPTGWELCDGANNRPDLRDKFVIGAGPKFTVGATGGDANASVISHTHSFTATTATGGTHNHDQRWGQASGDSGNYSGNNLQNFTNYAQTGVTADAGSHTHTVSGTTASTGFSGENANLPPYFALCYIIKT